MLIYHIVLPELWEVFKNKEEYEAESLQTEGFIHCSFAEQLDGVLRRYYSNAEKVLILSLDTEKLASKLINEPSTNNDIYPHIYGKINKSAIVEINEREINRR
ncbi:MAG: DUF952 domain-containing protein [Pyrinomonadaceae bacterium]|nr:DUF952 domain-containing protein [Pyrinomonadaceae bacterium]